MKVILLSTDKKIWVDNSDVRQRMREYAVLVESVHIFVFGQQKQQGVIEGNLFLHSVSSLFKILSPLVFLFLAIKIIRAHQLSKKDTVVDSQDPFEIGFLSWILKIFFGFKLQLQVHGDFQNDYFRREGIRNFFQYYLAKFLLPRADRVRVVSKRIKNSLIGRLGILESKIVYLPILFNVEYGTGKQIKKDLHQTYPQFDKIILMASRFILVKNIPLAIQAFKKVLSNYPKAGLLIVGSGPLKKQLQKIAGDCPNIIFEGWTEDLYSYYKTADIFLLSSNYEGWGMTVVEAATCGLPIIMTDVGCAGDFIIDGYNGKVVPVNDADKLSITLTEILTNEKERQILINNVLLSLNKLSSKKDYLNNLKKSWESCLYK